MKSFKLSKLLMQRPNDEVDPFFYWGHNIVGPVFVLFTHLLYQELKHKRINDIYFLARDGFLLKKLFTKFIDEFDSKSDFNLQYLCISRYTSFIASIRNITNKEILYACRGKITLEHIFSRFGIKIDRDIEKILRQDNLSPNKNIRYKYNRDLLLKLLNNEVIKNKILNNSKTMRNFLYLYLNKIDYFKQNKKIALVDTGWRGISQDLLHETFYNHENSPEMQGYYIALLVKSKPNKSGLIYDRRYASIRGMAMFLFIEAFELSSRALHGTTISYDHNGPIFDKSKKSKMIEKSIKHQIRSIQNGIISFANKYNESFKINSFNPNEFKHDIIINFNNEISFPNKKIVKAFSNFIHIDDFGLSKPKSISSSHDLHLDSILKNYLITLKSTPWREAYITNLRIPLLLESYYIVKMATCFFRIYIKDENY